MYVTNISVQITCQMSNCFLLEICPDNLCIRLVFQTVFHILLAVLRHRQLEEQVSHPQRRKTVDIQTVYYLKYLSSLIAQNGKHFDVTQYQSLIENTEAQPKHISCNIFIDVFLRDFQNKLSLLYMIISIHFKLLPFKQRSFYTVAFRERKLN